MPGRLASKGSAPSDPKPPLAIFVDGTNFDAIRAVSESALAMGELIGHGAADNALVSLHLLMNSAEKAPLPDI